MLSSDLSVFDTVLPTLDDGSKTLILFCVQAVPCLLTPVLLVNINRLAKSCRRSSPTVAVERPSPEIQKKAQTVLEVKKLSTCKAFMDCASGLSIVFAVFVWIKSSYVGLAAIPAFDLCLMPATLLWLGFVGVYQADVLPGGKHTVTVLSLSYNVVLLYNQILIRWLEVTDRDSLLLVCRLLAGFAFCDHRKAAVMQIAWIMLKTQTPPHVSNPNNGLNEVWDVLLWEIFRQFVFITPMWLLWFSVEYFVRQFTELMVQKADVNASLDAARSVLASQCDAEAFLRADLRFHNPSAKMAHFFGMKTEDLKDIRLVDLLDSRDAARFEKLVANSVQGLHVSGTNDEKRGQQTAASLNVTFKHGSGRRIETRIYLGSVPGLLGNERPGHLIAFNEVRDIRDVPEEYSKVVETDNAKTVISQTKAVPKAETHEVRAGAAAALSEHLPLNADTLAFHAWSYSKPKTSSAEAAGSIEQVNVVFEQDSFAVKEIQLRMSTSNCKHRRKIMLRECIVPQAWDELQNWMEAVKWDKTASAPLVLLFVFPKFVTGALAARHTEFSRLSNTKSSNELMLTLSDIRLRRFQSGRSGYAPTMGRGTASHLSRCSLDDQKL